MAPRDAEEDSHAIAPDAGVEDAGKASAEHASTASLRFAPKCREPPQFVQQLSPEGRAELERRLVRKIDLRLLPMIVLMYIMNYLDRNNIASARVQGLQDDLRLSDVQYQTAVSILFVGYLLMQVPSNLILNKIGKPALYLPGAMAVWGVISAATSAAQDFSGIIAVRFFLGFVEAAYFPGCLFFLSAWYTRKELGLRTALLYSGSLVSGAFAGLIAAGILNSLQGARGIAAWRWLFIIEGAITVFIAVLAVFILPDFPRTTTWLTEEERQLAVWRLDEDIGEDDWTSSEDQSIWHGFKPAVADPKMWILMLMFTCIISSASVTNFFPTVTQTLPGTDHGHVSSIEALLLTTPPYLLAVLTSCLNAWHADRTGERYFHITLPLYVAVAAFVLAVATTDFAPRYLAMLLMIPGVYTGFSVGLSWISSTMPRPPAKRAAALALINAVGNCSSIYASYLYTGAPRFVVAFTVNCVTAFVAILCATALCFMLVRLNKQLDRGEALEDTMSSGEAVPEEAAKKGFRFLY